MIDIPDLLHSARRTIRGLAGALAWIPPLLVRVILGILFVAKGWAGRSDGGLSWLMLVGGALLLVGLFSRAAALSLAIATACVFVTTKTQSLDPRDLAGQEELGYTILLLVLVCLGATVVSLDGLFVRWSRGRVEEQGLSAATVRGATNLHRAE